MYKDWDVKQVKDGLTKCLLAQWVQENRRRGNQGPSANKHRRTRGSVPAETISNDPPRDTFACPFTTADCAASAHPMEVYMDNLAWHLSSFHRNSYDGICPLCARPVQLGSLKKHSGIEVIQYTAPALNVINAVDDDEPFSAAAPPQMLQTSEDVNVQNREDVLSDAVVASNVHWYLDIANDEHLQTYAVADGYSSGPIADRWILDTEGDEYLDQSQHPLVRRIEDGEDPWATHWILDTRGDELLQGRNVCTDENVSDDSSASRWTLDTTGNEYLGRRPIVRAVEYKENRWATHRGR